MSRNGIAEKSLYKRRRDW